MGIKNLSQILNKEAPPVKREISFFSGKKVAVDASNVLYQCLIAIRGSHVTFNSSNFENAHLMGMFYKLIKFMENRINVIFIFDGKAPIEKKDELQMRTDSKENAREKQKEALELGDLETYRKMEKRQVRIEERHVEETITLLKLMGVPFYVAPGEAEAFAVLLNKNNLVDYVASEDMDILTYGGKLVRNLNSGKEKTKPILEYDYENILMKLNLCPSEFTDLCILLGCDYTGTLKGIGYNRSLTLIKEHKNIETILKKNEYEALPKYKTEETEEQSFNEIFDYEKARKMFSNEFSTEILEEIQNIKIKYKKPHYEGIIDFLCENKQFNKEKVSKGLERIKKVKMTKQRKISDFLIRKK